MSDMRAFVTGSYSYGTPGPDSDIDLVVFVTERDLNRLKNAVINKGPGADWKEAAADPDYIAAGVYPLRFGPLNLLCVTDEKRYEIWRRGTRKLKTQAPVSRAFAVEFMKRLRQEEGYAV